ncbi:MAG: glycine zipper domain-containing protein [Pseudomonadota bacterium]
MKTAALLALTAALAGCASPVPSGSVYAPQQLHQEQEIRMGYVESVREVVIARRDSGIGAMTGAAIGSDLASVNMGRGSGSFIGSILGALAGGIIGHHVEARINTRKAFEITVKLDSGELRAVTQAADELFQPGERVRLLSSGNSTRVTH